jgi:hypothetical protein
MPLERYNLTNIKELAKVLLYCNEDVGNTCRHTITYSEPWHWVRKYIGIP